MDSLEPDADEDAFKNKIRSPWLDAYFVYTSSLGTHTFFMILLPAFFFFGYGELARGWVELPQFDSNPVLIVETD